jgi:hypothetical protein
MKLTPNTAARNPICTAPKTRALHFYGQSNSPVTTPHAKNNGSIKLVLLGLLALVGAGIGGGLIANQVFTSTQRQHPPSHALTAPITPGVTGRTFGKPDIERGYGPGGYSILPECMNTLGDPNHAPEGPCKVFDTERPRR